jgi:hypothetical protein
VELVRNRLELTARLVREVDHHPVFLDLFEVHQHGVRYGKVGILGEADFLAKAFAAGRRLSSMVADMKRRG